MINTLFVEQISCQINFFAENIKRSPAGQRKRFSFTDMQIWDEPSDTAVRWYSRYNGHWKRAKTAKKELKNVWVNFSPTCHQKPERQYNTTIFHRPEKISYTCSIHYLTGQNRGLSGLKNIWPVIMTGDLLSVILSPGLSLRLRQIIDLPATDKLLYFAQPLPIIVNCLLNWQTFFKTSTGKKLLWMRFEWSLHFVSINNIRRIIFSKDRL